MIDRERILKARHTATELIRRLDACDKELRDSKYESYITGTAASGALRRQSMEVTRAMAELRKP